jgi:hypothetical protein
MARRPSREVDVPFPARSFLVPASPEQHAAVHKRVLVLVNVPARQPSPYQTADDDAACGACDGFAHANATLNANDDSRNDVGGGVSLWNDDSFPSTPRSRLTCCTVACERRVACSDDRTGVWRSLLPSPPHPATKVLESGSDESQDDPKGHTLHLISITRERSQSADVPSPTANATNRPLFSLRDMPSYIPCKSRSQIKKTSYAAAPPSACDVIRSCEWSAWW